MRDFSRNVAFHQVRTLAFGAGCSTQCASALAERKARSVFIVTAPLLFATAEPLLAQIRRNGCAVTVWADAQQEPTIRDFAAALAVAREARADAVIGLGGGSAMDVAKLVSAFLDSEQSIDQAFGVGKLASRRTWLACLPTTSGTGSEVSPIAILLDEADELKKGVVSPHLVPDAAFVDPMFTLTMPPSVTAATGIDAFTHCVEAFANRFAHPIIDNFAIEGIRLISGNLVRAIEHGQDIEARTCVSLGSLYGGMCLGPVNTAAVHALSYPLGGEFHVAHGVANAVLLPHVLAFNLPAAPKRYAEVAIALGAAPGGTDEETALRGLERVRELSRQCGLPATLAHFGIDATAIDRMSQAAMTVTRLLERNLRVVTEQDAKDIYRGGPVIGEWYTKGSARLRRVFWTCSTAWALDSMDALVYQYLIPVLMVAFGMTLAEAGSIASANYFASALGGWIGGWLCDRFGRARILQVTIAWFALFSFISGFAQSYEQLLFIRILQGIGFGAEWAVGAVLLGEMVMPAHRGKAVGTMHSAAAIGSGLAALLAGPVVALFDPEYGWRIVFWVGLLPAVLIVFIRRGDDDSDVYKEASRKAREAGRTANALAIFSPKVIRTTLLACLLAIGAQGAGFAVSNYLTTFLQHERGLSPSIAGVFVLMNSAGGFFGFLVNAGLSDRVGRRTIFRLFGAGFVLAATFYLYAPLGSSMLTLMPAGFVYGFFQFGIYASFGPYFTELFPTEMRGTGQAFAYNFGRATSALFIQGVALVAAVTTLGIGMLAMGIAGVCCAVIATLMLPETAGRDLTAIGSREPAPNRIEAKEVT